MLYIMGTINYEYEYSVYCPHVCMLYLMNSSLSLRHTVVVAPWPPLLLLSEEEK